MHKYLTSLKTLNIGRNLQNLPFQYSKYSRYSIISLPYKIPNSLYFPQPQYRCFAKRKTNFEKQKERKEQEKEQIKEQFPYEDADEMIEDLRERMKIQTKRCEEEMKKVSTGRISPQILNDIKVTAYGDKHPILSLCQVVVVDANMLNVNLFDAGLTDASLKALQKSNIEAAFKLEGPTRISIKVTETQRESKELKIKQIKEMGAICKTKIKEIRYKGMDLCKQLIKVVPFETAEMYKNKTEGLTKEANSNVDKIILNKEKEIRNY